MKKYSNIVKVLDIARPNVYKSPIAYMLDIGKL